MNENPASAVSRPSAVGILISVVKLAIVLPFFAVLYAYWQIYIPLLVIGKIAAMGIASFMVGALLGMEIKKARLNWSDKTVSLLGMLFGAILLYITWAVWLNLILYAGGDFKSGFSFIFSNVFVTTTLELLASPLYMLDLMVEVSKVGTWGLAEDWIFKGGLLWVFWLAEAGIAIYLAGFGATDKEMRNLATPPRKNI